MPLSLELRLAGILLALAGVLGLVGWAAHHERQIGATQCRADVATATAKAAQDALAESDRRTQAQAEVSHEADRLASRARADAAGVAAVDLRLLTAAGRAACPAANPTAASGGAPADQSRWVPAELLEKSLGESRELAARADAAFIAGQACEWSYDSLIPKH